MARIAVLSDVHGNLMALRVAVEEIVRWRPDRVWFLGDAVIFGPDPAECVELLERELAPEVCIEGNTDRYLREDRWRRCLQESNTEDPFYPIALAIEACDRALDDPQRERLGTYRQDAKTEVEGVRFHLCHGAPGDDEFRLAADEDPEEVLSRVASAQCDVVLCGHTHIPWRYPLDDGELINDGSVGYPFDGDVRGCWCSLEVNDGRLTRVGFHRFDFDREETIRRLEAWGPLSSILVRRLRTGKQ